MSERTIGELLSEVVATMQAIRGYAHNTEMAGNRAHNHSVSTLGHVLVAESDKAMASLADIQSRLEGVDVAAQEDVK